MTKQEKREMLLLIMLEDCANLFKLQGYARVKDKLEANIKKLYPTGKPDTTKMRETLENARRMD